MVPTSITQAFALRGGTSEGLRSFYHSDHNYEFAPGPRNSEFNNPHIVQAYQSSSATEIQGSNGQIGGQELRKQQSYAKDAFISLKQLNASPGSSAFGLQKVNRPQTTH